MVGDGTHALKGNVMGRQYASFLLRCWRLGDGEQRIKIEHIQSGVSMQVATVAAALAWIADRLSPHPVGGGDPGLTGEAPQKGGET